jgi:myosin V
MGSLETKIDETEQKFEEMKRAREEWLKKATDAESKINELTNTVLRLALSICVILFYGDASCTCFTDFIENCLFCMVSSFQEKVTNMEAENQLLRQQALLRTPVRTIPENASPKSVCGFSIT